MHKGRMFFVVGMCLLLAAALMQPADAATSAVLASGGAPTITIGASTLSFRPTDTSCPVEMICVTVNWTARAPSGTKINGYKLTVKANLATGVQTSSVDVPASASSGKVQFFTSDLCGVSFTATVTANYSSSSETSQSGTYPACQ